VSWSAPRPRGSGPGARRARLQLLLLLLLRAQLGAHHAAPRQGCAAHLGLLAHQLLLPGKRLLAGAGCVHRLAAREQLLQGRLVASQVAALGRLTCLDLLQWRAERSRAR
jgi:hypothetical protein